MSHEDNILSINWNDIKFLIVLSRHKRLTKSAEILGISRVTVSNRLHSIQKYLGEQIFYQSENGFELTKKGREFIFYAEEIERQLVLGLEDLKEKSNIQPKVRIGVTEGLGENYLMPHLAEWMKTNGIDIDFISLPKITKVSNREVDISITMEKPHGEFLIRKLLTTYTLGIYANNGYLEKQGLIKREDELQQHLWIGYVEELLFADELKYHHEISRNLNFVFRSTTIRSQKEAAKKGLGLSILPNYMSRKENDLVRVLPDYNILRQYWISTNKDLHQFRSVRLVWDFLLSTVENDRALFF